MSIPPSSVSTTASRALGLAGSSACRLARCLPRAPLFHRLSLRFPSPILRHGNPRFLASWMSPSPALLPVDVAVDEEKVPGYRPEHYYPANPGDLLAGRYRLLVKVGWGSSSTVWLADDTRSGNCLRPKRYVAVKLCNYDTSDKEMTHELDMSIHLSSANPQYPGRAALATAFKGYMIESPRGGKHLALLFEPMREPLWLFRRRITHQDQVSHESLPLIKTYIKILLEGLDYMHSQSHVIHTDLKLDNIMVTCEDNSTVAAFIQKQVSNPMACKHVGDRTIYQCHNDFGPVTEGLGNIIPQITDFGLAQRGDKPEPLIHPIQPDEFRAPEVLLGTGWSYSADIWNFGAMIWELLSGCSLFRQPGTDPYSPAQHVADMMALIGPPNPALKRRERDMRHWRWSPAALNSRGQLSSTAAEFYGGPFFGNNGAFVRVDLIPTRRSLENEVPQCVLEENHVDLFLEFMKKMLCWLPEERATAGELLLDPWLNLDTT